ncbi:Cyclin-dependent kinase-like 4 [Colletotrichum siamense]|uniref:Cyclin-dependent kinase-like 4 n=1 Tax=Colletotrichum siamense TaxID=690259 RepID=UPI0018730530|nr:Cyclin-dependent kinase-like 4 [Colletotrichum siamense]KAF5492667.1 Cyclin-dependent kinase-like 4 [Colletotrichum siamense]
MDIESEIRERIEEPTDGKPFLPNDAIDELTARRNVREYLRANCQYLPKDANIDSLVRYVTDEDNPARRVFLILAHCDCVQHLSLLQQDGFYDADLPITKTWEKTAKRYRVHTNSRRKSQTQRSNRKLWHCFDRWKRSRDVEDFDTKQWRFMAPVFGADTFDYHLSPKCPLPITEESVSTRKVGYSGVVVSVKIHEAHIQDKYKGQQIAFKQLHPNMDAYYAQESEALRMINELNNPHLIQPLAAYTRGDRCGFFFPWANGGTLEDYWRNNPRPEGEANIRWVLNQLYGLSGATKALHQKNCRHTDLKPSNILLFIEKELPGRLRIADVGLAKIHKDETTQRERLNIITSAKTSTKRYEAPELQQQVDQLSRVFDVWSLGCVFLEFLVWTCYGRSRVDRFIDLNTPFWHVSSGEYQRSLVVDELIDSLRSDIANNGGGTALKRCLDFVDKRMLVPEYKNRADASETRDEFRSIRTSESRNNGYFQNIALTG